MYHLPFLWHKIQPSSFFKDLFWTCVGHSCLIHLSWLTDLFNWQNWQILQSHKCDLEYSLVILSIVVFTLMWNWKFMKPKSKQTIPKSNDRRWQKPSFQFHRWLCLLCPVEDENWVASTSSASTLSVMSALFISNEWCHVLVDLSTLLLRHCTFLLSCSCIICLCISVTCPSVFSSVVCVLYDTNLSLYSGVWVYIQEYLIRFTSLLGGEGRGSAFFFSFFECLIDLQIQQITAFKLKKTLVVFEIFSLAKHVLH